MFLYFLSTHLHVYSIIVKQEWTVWSYLSLWENSLRTKKETFFIKELFRGCCKIWEGFFVFEWSGKWESLNYSQGKINFNMFQIFEIKFSFLVLRSHFNIMSNVEKFFFLWAIKLILRIVCWMTWKRGKLDLNCTHFSKMAQKLCEKSSRTHIKSFMEWQEASTQHSHQSFPQKLCHQNDSKLVSRFSAFML